MRIAMTTDEPLGTSAALSAKAEPGGMPPESGWRVDERGCPVVHKDDYDLLRSRLASALTLLERNEGRVKAIVDEQLLARAEKAEEENARLQRIATEYHERMQDADGELTALRAQRNGVIEECARVCESLPPAHRPQSNGEIRKRCAKAIRALSRMEDL
jgi:hypothetical protein